MNPRTIERKLAATERDCAEAAGWMIVRCVVCGERWRDHTDAEKRACAERAEESR